MTRYRRSSNATPVRPISARRRRLPEGARMRIPYEPPDETYPINVTNMIDVFLLLLIFFLVATTFAKEERDAKVQLPGTAAVRPISAPSKDLVLNIREDGTV